MKKSKLWTLAMALAATLGGPMDPDLEEAAGSVHAVGRRMDADPAGGHSNRDDAGDAWRNPVTGKLPPA